MGWISISLRIWIRIRNSKNSQLDPDPEKNHSGSTNWLTGITLLKIYNICKSAGAEILRILKLQDSPKPGV